jgi:2-keto-4-pentenoate hydratase/2-oxohepta-3-ene-1,7-dioic acid hydratase in catechol pathway
VRITRVLHDGVAHTCQVEADRLRAVTRVDGSVPEPWEVAAGPTSEFRVVADLAPADCLPLTAVAPRTLLEAEDNFLTQARSRKTGLAAMRPVAIEPFRRSDPAEDVWIIPRDPRSIARPGQPILLPTGTTELDAGVTVAAVSDERGHVAAYCVAIEVVRRDVPIEHAYLARSYASHTQLGSVLCTPDELDRPELITLTLTVDGQLRQQARMSEMVVQAPVLLRSIRNRCVITGGDIILLGTPHGTGLDTGTGWLREGNVVQAHVDDVGDLVVKVERPTNETMA